MGVANKCGGGGVGYKRNFTVDAFSVYIFFIHIQSFHEKSAEHVLGSVSRKSR